MRQFAAVTAHRGIAAFELQVPEDLSTVSDEDLERLRDQGVEEFDALLDEAGDAPSPEQLERMEALAAQVTALRAEVTQRETAAQERQENLARLREQVHPADEAEGDEPPAVEGEPAPVAETEPVAVAAAATPERPSLAAARRNQPVTPTGRAPARRSGARSTLIASGGSQEFTPGAEIDLEGAARLWLQKRSGLQMAGKGRQHMHIASVRTEFPEELVASAYEGQSVQDALAAAVDESRLEGGSLTAAAGWCSPSETIYDVVGDGASLDGLVSFPEIQVNRGGIKFTKGVDFASVYANGFKLTEAQVQADTAKTIDTVACPSFTDVRSDVIGYAVKTEILVQDTFPEVIADFLGQSLVAHQHRVSQNTISKALALATDMGTVPTAAVSGSVTLLAVLEFIVEDIRTRRVLSRTGNYEVALPYWIRPLMRDDYSKRNAVDLPLEVTDAMIDNWFAIRGINVQFTYDFQTGLTQAVGGDTGADAVRMGSATPPTQYPNKVQALIYPAGAFVSGLDNIITINALYDSTLLTGNKQLALFTEQKHLVAFRGHDARKVTIPLLPNGQSASQVAYAGQL